MPPKSPWKKVSRKIHFPHESQLKSLSSEPSHKKPEEHYSGCSFRVVGQGTYSVTLNNKEREEFRIIIKSNETEEKAFVLHVTKEIVYFRNRNDNEESSVLGFTKAQKALLERNERKYWFSLDKKNKALLYGKGEAQKALTLMQTSDVKETFDAQFVYLSVDRHHVLDQEFWPLPVVASLSPLVIATEEVTLEDIEFGNYTPISNLPKECQVLYGTVAGPKIKLESSEFPDFVDALRRSINTPGLMCYQKLEEKKNEFGDKNEKETYLRITLGKDQGYSPGVPYVVEVWPAEHFSPIHQHSKAFAVIKVLHGTIHASFFPELNLDVLDCFLGADLQEGSVSWISPDYFQTHQLKNTSNDVCVTIQCYMYAETDTKHYEYFDYLKLKERSIGHFVPNSDWDYLDFKEKLQTEWDNRSDPQAKSENPK